MSTEWMTNPCLNLLVIELLRHIFQTLFGLSATTSWNWTTAFEMMPSMTILYITSVILNPEFVILATKARESWQIWSQNTWTTCIT